MWNRFRLRTARGPKLYAAYTPEEALRLLAPTRWASEWGGQLRAADDTLVLFAPLGDANGGSHFPNPDRFRFRPDQPFAPREAEHGWMPLKLGRHARDGRELHLLAATGTEESYRYLGRLSLAKFTGAADFRHQYADFDLLPRLPREWWLRFGGNEGWKVSLNHKERFFSLGEVGQVESLLREMGVREDLHLTVTRYEGDCLALLANGSDAYLSYQDVAGGYRLSRNGDYPTDTEEAAAFFCACGTALDMPRCNVVERGLALRGVAAYLLTGSLPATIEWSEEE